MSTLGINKYVLENLNEESYDFFISIIEDYKKHGKPEGYHIGTLWGCMNFYIEKEIPYEDGAIDYLVVAKNDKGDPIGASYIDPNEIRYDGDNVYLMEMWDGLPGVLELLCHELDMDEKPEFYYMSSNEWDEAGATNDKEGKYFRRRCVIDMVEHIPDPDFLEKVIPAGFESLPFEEQVAICTEHDIAYNVTQIMSFSLYWEFNKVELCPSEES